MYVVDPGNSSRCPCSQARRKRTRQSGRSLPVLPAVLVPIAGLIGTVGVLVEFPLAVVDGTEVVTAAPRAAQPTRKRQDWDTDSCPFVEDILGFNHPRCSPERHHTVHFRTHSHEFKKAFFSNFGRKVFCQSCSPLPSGQVGKSKDPTPNGGQAGWVGAGRHGLDRRISCSC